MKNRYSCISYCYDCIQSKASSAKMYIFAKDCIEKSFKYSEGNFNCTFMENVPNWQDKDIVDHTDLSWFSGVSKFINADLLLHQIAGAGEKRKRNKAQKAAKDIEHEVSGDKKVYAKSINGQHKVYFVYSNDNLSQKGFYGMCSITIQGFHHCLVVYDVKPT